MKNSAKYIDRLVTKNNQIIEKHQDVSDLFSAVSSSQKRFAKVIRTEDTSNDLRWIDVIEDAVPYLQKIVDNPRKFIKSVNYLVKAELAKKTGPESVVHLATHSQYVKDIDENGDIIPSKVLTSDAEEDFAIYENKFVVTLIRRLNMYVKKRYEYAKKYASLTNSTILYLDNTFKFGDVEITQTSTVTLKTPASDELKKQADNVLKRVAFVDKVVSSFMSGKFMKELKNVRPILPPIMQTNIIRKNPNYHKAYELWLYLGEEEKTEMNFLVTEDIKALTKDEEKRIDLINYLTVMDVLDSEKQRSLRFTKRKYKVKVLKNVDDKLYLNDKFSKVDLVRTDELYYDNLKKINEERLEKASPKVKKEVFKKEVAEIAKIDQKKKAALALQKRKEKAALLLEKKLEKEKLAEEKRREKEEILKQKEAAKERVSEIKRLRRHVVSTAKKDSELMEEASKNGSK